MTRSAKSRGPHPDFRYNRVTDIDPEWIRALGVRGILLDIDNTITRWEDTFVPPDELAWLDRIQKAGLPCRLISNGLGHKRARIVEQTGISQIRSLAVKPLAAAFNNCLADMSVPAEQAMMIGDIIMTDIWPANRIGIWTSLVDPLSQVDFVGTKAWRVMERVLNWRRPLHVENDFTLGPPR